MTTNLQSRRNSQIELTDLRHTTVGISMSSRVVQVAIGPKADGIPTIAHTFLNRNLELENRSDYWVSWTPLTRYRVIYPRLSYTNLYCTQLCYLIWSNINVAALSTTIHPHFPDNILRNEMVGARMSSRVVRIAIGPELSVWCSSIWEFRRLCKFVVITTRFLSDYKFKMLSIRIFLMPPLQ